jgi:acyl dehydratase
MAAAVYSIDELKGRVGEVLGESSVHQVSQDQIDRFADATGDHQWIHVDRERARSGPFGTTIAHGYLTLSLLPMLLAECMTISDAGMMVNYGLNRLRFPSPVPAGSGVRMKVALNSAEEIDGGVQLLVGFEIGDPSAGKPAAVGEAVLRAYPR